MNNLKKEKIRNLKRKILELEAQLSCVYHFVEARIDKASTSHMMASGVLIQIYALGGREITPPFVIRDGLSQKTIEALKDDILRSYNTAVAFKPKLKRTQSNE